MATKNIIARGLGFSAGSVKWIVTAGFSIGVAIVVNTLIGRPKRAVADAGRYRAAAATPNFRAVAR